MNFGLTSVDSVTHLIIEKDLVGQDRMVVVVANLPVKKMVGQVSYGMLLCASNADHTVVEPLTPPADAPVGERIFWGSDSPVQSEAATPNQVPNPTSSKASWFL